MHRTVPDDMQIKKMSPEDFEQFNNLLRYAFQVTEEQLLQIGWEDEDFRQSKFPILESANVLGYFQGDRLASQIAVYPLKMNIHGKVCDIGFVTGVATYPEYSGMGLVSSLMKETLTQMRESGQSICLLYPYSIPFYRHKGWELISDKMGFKVRDTQLPQNLEVPGTVRRVAQDDPALRKLHDRFVKQTHGCILRTELVWEEYWRWDVDDMTVALYYDAKGRAQGYLVYLLKKEVMHIKEMAYLNQEAFKGLWNYISAHESMVTEVSGSNYSNDTMAFWFEDSDIKETIRPYIMGRIVDVKRFLRQYSFSPGVRAEERVTFIVRDDLLEWNNGSFTLHFVPGQKPRLVRGMAEKTVELSIGTLTTMLMSYKRPTYLRAIERLKADRETIAFLESVIPMEKAHISDYI